MANYYGFKINPKQQVVNKAKQLFGRDSKVVVSGTRPSPLDCKQLGIPAGNYYVDCTINNMHIASANAKDWRKAYLLLRVAVEKNFENNLYNAV